MNNVVKLHEEYNAKLFTVDTIYGEFKIAGTLCGAIDLALPTGNTLALTPDEVAAIISALSAARHDVLENSRPFTDLRLIGTRSDLQQGEETK